MADAVIAVFDSKYTYQKKRPFMLDPTIKTVMPTPNHPSYPAGHGTISGSAATVLAHYFPANTTEWARLGQEASISRSWAGIHFTIDNSVGYSLGESVAGETLRKGASQ
jgi:membrane-associated phospholipid phosphatase